MRNPLCAERLVSILVGVLILVGGASQAHAASWKEKARQMSRRKLSVEEARSKRAAEEKERRNRIAMRRIRPAMQGVDWDADPTAIPSVLYQIHKRTDLPVYYDNSGLDVASDELFEFTVIYLTAHTAFSFNEKETENLKRWLERGGTLFLDDCYLRGSPFADSVPVEVAKLIPEAEARWLLKDDPRVNDAFRMIYPTDWPGESGKMENRYWQYYLLDDRPAVFFTPNDDGCGWEYSTPPSASNPLGNPIGHGGNNPQREIMFQWAANAILFMYTH